MNKSKVDPAALIAATMAAVLTVVLSPGEYTPFEMTIGLTLLVALIGYGWPSQVRDDVIIFACAAGFGLFIFVAFWLEQIYILAQLRLRRTVVGIPPSHAAGWWLVSAAIAFGVYHLREWRARRGRTALQSSEPEISTQLETPMTDDSLAETRKIGDAEMGRMLDHGMHEEGIFYSRLNFFLLFESLLLGAVIQTATASGARIRILQFLALALGLAVLIVWVYAQTKKLKYLKCLEARLADRLPEFKEIRERRGRFHEASQRSRSANTTITYIVPLLIFLAWLGVGMAVWLG